MYTTSVLPSGNVSPQPLWCLSYNTAWKYLKQLTQEASGEGWSLAMGVRQPECSSVCTTWTWRPQVRKITLSNYFQTYRLSFTHDERDSTPCHQDQISPRFSLRVVRYNLAASPLPSICTCLTRTRLQEHGVHYLMEFLVAWPCTSEGVHTTSWATTSTTEDCPNEVALQRREAQNRHHRHFVPVDYWMEHHRYVCVHLNIMLYTSCECTINTLVTSWHARWLEGAKSGGKQSQT